MDSQLTLGAIRRWMGGQIGGCPIVQIFDIKKISGSNNSDRYRLCVSDGELYQQAMLATQQNHLIQQNQIQDGSIVQLTEFITNVVASRQIIIILCLEIKHPGPLPRIGTPASVETITPVQPPQPQNQPMRPNQPPQQHRTHIGGTGLGPSSNFAPSLTGGPVQIHPIASLNPYQSRWTIKARVTSKGDVKTWTNAKGEGKLMSIELLDAMGGQIRATMFNDAVDKFYDLLQEGKVYQISKGQLKLANKKFSRLPNDYELTLGIDSDIQYVGEDNQIQHQKFSFKPNIEAITQVEKDEFVDVIGIVSNVGPVTELTTRKSTTVKKRVITLTDMSLTSIEITLWSDVAEKYNESTLANNPVLAVKSCRVSDFGGKSLSASFDSSIFINPDRPESHQLRAWWDRDGYSSQIEPMTKKAAAAVGGAMSTERKMLCAIKDEQLGFHEKPDYFNVRATITYFRSEPGQDNSKVPWYPACPSPNCNKKVSTGAQGDYICDKCNKSYPTYEARYILSFLICDSTGAQWLNAFNDQAEQLLGHKAGELASYKEQGMQMEYENVFSQANFKSYIFKCRAKSENVQDETRVRCHVISIQPIDYVTESKYLLDEIAKYQ